MRVRGNIVVILAMAVGLMLYVAMAEASGQGQPAAAPTQAQAQGQGQHQYQRQNQSQKVHIYNPVTQTVSVYTTVQPAAPAAEQPTAGIRAESLGASPQTVVNEVPRMILEQVYPIYPQPVQPLGTSPQDSHNLGFSLPDGKARFTKQEAKNLVGGRGTVSYSRMVINHVRYETPELEICEGADCPKDHRPRTGPLEKYEVTKLPQGTWVGPVSAVGDDMPAAYAQAMLDCMAMQGELLEIQSTPKSADWETYAKSWGIGGAISSNSISGGQGVVQVTGGGGTGYSSSWGGQEAKPFVRGACYK